MSASGYDDLVWHVGHEIECVTYGVFATNVAVECVDCGEVLLDFDYPAARRRVAAYGEALRNTTQEVP